MNIRTMCTLLVCAGAPADVMAQGVKSQWLAGVHSGQSSDTTATGWTQVSAGHRWQQRQWKLQLSSGYLHLDDQRSGMADSWLRATWLFQQPWLKQWWDVQWRLKLPTADASKGLGTGSVDNEVRAQALIQWQPVLAWYYGGYRVRGNSSEYDLQNGIGWGAGMAWQRWSLAYDGRESSFSGRSALHDITLIRSFRLGQTRLSPYLRRRNADEWGAGISLRW